MTNHVVRPGECLTSIAANYGFKDARALADANPELADLRPDLAVLYPGDVVRVPAPRSQPKTVAAGASHTIRVGRATRKVKVQLLDDYGEPFGSLPFTADDEDAVHSGQTDGEGWLELEVPVTTTELDVDVDGEVRVFRLGHLNPVEIETDDQGTSGAQGRLSALGFDPGAVDGELGPRSRAALAAFQRAHGLAVTAELDDDTRAGLAREYGA